MADPDSISRVFAQSWNSPQDSDIQQNRPPLGRTPRVRWADRAWSSMQGVNGCGMRAGAPPSQREDSARGARPCGPVTSTAPLPLPNSPRSGRAGTPAPEAPMGLPAKLDVPVDHRPVSRPAATARARSAGFSRNVASVVSQHEASDAGPWLSNGREGAGHPTPEPHHPLVALAVGSS